LKRNDLNRAFGPAPEEFLNRVEDTLNHLEERNMKRRYKLTTLVAAALIVALLLAGAGFAASRLKLFDYLNGSMPIVPLNDAESMIQTELGFAENELIRVAVEEGVYDGYGVLLKLNVSAVDPEKRLGSALSLAVGLATEEENVLWVSMPKAVFIDENGASARHNSVYNEDGVVVSDLTSARTAQEEDGSMSFWLSGNEMPVNVEELPLLLSVMVTEDVNAVKPEELSMELSLKRAGEARRAHLVFEDLSPFENLNFVSAEVAYTDVRGYLTLDYIYQPNYMQPLNLMFNVYDADGNALSQADGWGSDGPEGRRSERIEIQSSEETPGRLILEILDGETLAPICRVPATLEPVG